MRSLGREGWGWRWEPDPCFSATCSVGPAPVGRTHLARGVSLRTQKSGLSLLIEKSALDRAEGSDY